MPCSLKCAAVILVSIHDFFMIVSSNEMSFLDSHTNYCKGFNAHKLYKCHLEQQCLAFTISAVDNHLVYFVKHVINHAILSNWNAQQEGNSPRQARRRFQCAPWKPGSIFHGKPLNGNRWLMVKILRSSYSILGTFGSVIFHSNIYHEKSALIIALGATRHPTTKDERLVMDVIKLSHCQTL